MTNPDNVGGLPELPEPMNEVEVFCDEWGYGTHVAHDHYYTADQMRAYGELCRAAPAGGDAVRDALAGQTIYLMGREHISDERKPMAELVYGMTVPGTGVLFCMKDTEAAIPKDAAPAGSGQVEAMAKRLDDARAIEEETSGLEDTIDAMRTAAALLRKLQQGAE